MSEKQDIEFLHDIKNKTVINGKRLIHEEFVIHGNKGLTIKFFHKDDKSMEKIVIFQKNDKYFMKSTIDDKKEEKELSKDELIKELTKNKSLKFALEYVSKQKGGDCSSSNNLYGGKRSRKGSKKSSRKGSKKLTGGKRSRKGSKKSSRKGSKK
jgi:hypothetical protein